MIRSSLDKYAFIFPILCAGVLIAYCIFISGQKEMWGDEIMDHYSISIESFSSFLPAITDNLNGGGWIYFMTAWVWGKVFSTSALSLRLFSSVGMCIGMLMTWATLKKYYGVWSASLATSTVFLCSTLILYQDSEARCYGMLLALTATLLYVTERSLGKSTFKLTTAFILFLLNGLLPVVHIFGFGYSLIFILGTMVIDWRIKKMRWWYYGSSLLGWVLFIPFIPAFKKVYALSQPHFWIPVPTFADFLNLYAHEWRSFAVFLIVCLVLFVLRVFVQERSIRAQNSGPVLFFGLLFLLFPAAVWVYSQFFTSLFWPRYVINFELGLAVIFAAIIARLLPTNASLNTFQKTIIGCLFLVILCMPFSGFIKIDQQPVSTGIEDGGLPSGVPIATTNAKSYTTRFYYNPLKKDYYFLLDWENANMPEVRASATQSFRTMSSMKRYFPDQNIIKYEDFLKAFDTFVIYDSPSWFNMRIKNNPDFSFKEIKTGVFLVQRLPIVPE